MPNLRLLLIALATILMLAFGVLALVNRSTQQMPGDDIIIIKGGSLTLQCPGYVDCLEASDGKGKYNHKGNKDEVKDPSKKKKVRLIVIKDDAGNVLGSFSDVNFPNGKPSIEITYK